jgi:hypothetical protein
MGQQNRHETAWVLHLYRHGYPTDDAVWGTVVEQSGRVHHGRLWAYYGCGPTEHQAQIEEWEAWAIQYGARKT